MGLEFYVLTLLQVGPNVIRCGGESERGQVWVPAAAGILRASSVALDDCGLTSLSRSICVAATSSIWSLGCVIHASGREGESLRTFQPLRGSEVTHVRAMTHQEARE